MYTCSFLKFSFSETVPRVFRPPCVYFVFFQRPLLSRRDKPTNPPSSIAEKQTWAPWGETKEPFPLLAYLAISLLCVLATFLLVGLQKFCCLLPQKNVAATRNSAG
jgi:hypothetical protein